MVNASQVDAERKANAGVAGSLTERTYIMIKPDGVQRGLVGEIISRFEKKGYKCVPLLPVIVAAH